MRTEQNMMNLIMDKTEHDERIRALQWIAYSSTIETEKVRRFMKDRCNN